MSKDFENCLEILKRMEQEDPEYFVVVRSMLNLWASVHPLKPC